MENPRSNMRDWPPAEASQTRDYQWNEDVTRRDIGSNTYNCYSSGDRYNQHYADQNAAHHRYAQPSGQTDWSRYSPDDSVDRQHYNGVHANRSMEHRSEQQDASPQPRGQTDWSRYSSVGLIGLEFPEEEEQHEHQLGGDAYEMPSHLQAND